MKEKPWHKHYDFTVLHTIRYPRIAVHEVLNFPSKAFPKNDAYDFFGSRMSYWDLREQVIKMANALIERGIKKGDRVGIHLPNCPQYLIAYYAILSTGAVVVNLNPLYTPPELKVIAADTALAALITFDMFLANVKELCSAVDIPTVIVTKITDYIDGFPKSTPEELSLEKGWLHFSQFMESTAGKYMPIVEIHPEDPALIQFTGGTTGTPKGAVLTHANVIAGIIQTSTWGSGTTGIIPPDRRSTLAVLPFFHAYGNIVALGWSMMNCAKLILVPRFELEEFIGIISKFEEITFFPAVPTLINAVINHPRAEELNLGRKFGLMNSGAAPMPVELIQKAKEMGIFYSEGWGMSETTSLGSSNPILGLKKNGSIGIPFPDMEIKLVDPEKGKKEVPEGEPGEMIIKGPLVMQGYWNKPDETKETIKNGWLHTGDIAIRDGDGYLFIVDRKKDMVIAGGFNVYPREIDEVLHEHPKVLEAVSIGVPDEYRGETIKAFIVPKQGETITEEDIISFCKKRLAAYKVPKIVEFRTELPKSMVGKILRKILREEELEKRKKKGK